MQKAKIKPQRGWPAVGPSCLLLVEPLVLAPLVKNNHLSKSHQLLLIYIQEGSKGAGSAMASGV